nr:MAG TPA: hypothetical protein [Caudoviricetes sp.]
MIYVLYNCGSRYTPKVFTHRQRKGVRILPQDGQPNQFIYLSCIVALHIYLCNIYISGVAVLPRIFIIM